MDESQEETRVFSEELKVSSNLPDDDGSLANYGDNLPPEFLWINEGANCVLVTIYAYKDPQTGRLRNISLDVNPVFRDLGLIEFPIESDWSVPDREQVESHRENASRFDPRARAYIIHRPTLQNLLIKHHLLELRFRGSSGDMTPLDLPRDKKGLLTKEAFKILGKLHPSVLDLLYLKFTDESALLI